MAKPKFVNVYGVRFSKDDVRFLDDQAEKQNMLRAFVVLLALERVLDLSTRVGRITRLADLAIPITETAIDVSAANWEDAANSILNLQFSQAMTDTQLHLFGRYMIQGKPLKAPSGKAKDFFKNLTNYYTQLRDQLSPASLNDE
jgi:hypothetical protein